MNNDHLYKYGFTCEYRINIILMGAAAVIVVVIFILFVMVVLFCVVRTCDHVKTELTQLSPLIPLRVVQVIEDMEKEKPIRFTAQHLRTATNNLSHVLGSGTYGTVYKGISRNNIPLAVKVLKGPSDKIIEEQFIAEVSTMGRTHHYNLIRLYGFCFESSLIALVYEFMVNGSLDNHLFKSNKGVIIGFEKLHEIAVGTANGLSYLHEQCANRIVHYDIKPANILLDSNFSAKVADFGLAKLCNRDSSHITRTGFCGTLGYAAPEISFPFQASHKCDVYSFGMLLFEIVGHRKNLDVTYTDIQEWFPIWAWNKYEQNKLNEFMIDCGIEEKHEEVITRMLMVALCCVQYKPENRPMMSIVVKMLEGDIEVPQPLNPFSHMFSAGTEPDDSFARIGQNGGGSDSFSTEALTTSTGVTGTSSLMARHEITVATD